jgi:hypothetical protein
METNLDLSKFWRWQKDCPDYGKKDGGNIFLKSDMGRETERFSSARPAAIVPARLMGHHSSASIRPWMKSAERLLKFRKKGVFVV